MADDGFTVKIDDALAGEVKAAAAARGVPVETFVREVLVNYVEDWSEARDRLAEYDRTGEFIDAGQALAEFREAVAGKSGR